MKNLLGLFLLVLTFFYGVLVNAQKQGNIWYFGNAGIDFNSGMPQALTNSSMNTTESCATISDSNGNLLFYTNGGSLWTSIGAIWNKNHQIMPNGLLMDTAGCSSASQGCIIIPNPGNNNEYYLFTVDCVENQFSSTPSNRGLRYTKVNMTLDSGLGDVTEKGILVMPIPVTSIGSTGYETVCAIPHSNGNDFWIVANKNGAICKVLVSASGVGLYNCQNFGTGQITPSPKGDKLMIGNILYNFNQSNGLLSDSIALSGSYSSFSSNGKVLYTKIGNSLFQYDLTAPNVGASVVTITSNVSGAPRLAPNGKIYFFGSAPGQFLNGVINCPNSIGLGCDYLSGNVLDLGTGRNKNNSVPNFLQSYFYKNNESTQSLSVCSNYLWTENGQNYNQSGVYSTNLTSANGCDSTLILDLTILQPSYSFQSMTACNSFTWNVNGQTYYQSGQYSEVLTNNEGCDSLITLDLNINLLNTDISLVDDFTLQSNIPNAQTYQWIDCENNFQNIVGETNQTFVSNVNGSFAVIVNENGCSDTSNCLSINTLGLNDVGNEILIVFPNPTRNYLRISLNDKLLSEFKLIDALGQSVIVGTINDKETIVDVSTLSRGMYTLLISSESLIHPVFIE